MLVVDVLADTGAIFGRLLYCCKVAVARLRGEEAERTLPCSEMNFRRSPGDQADARGCPLR